MYENFCIHPLYCGTIVWLALVGLSVGVATRKSCSASTRGHNAKTVANDALVSPCSFAMAQAGAEGAWCASRQLHPESCCQP